MNTNDEQALSGTEVVYAGWERHKYAQGTMEGIAFARGARWWSERQAQQPQCHKRANDYCMCSRKAMLCDGFGPAQQPQAEAVAWRARDANGRWMYGDLPAPELPAGEPELLALAAPQQAEAASKCAQCQKPYKAGATTKGCPKCAPGVVVAEAEFQTPIGQQAEAAPKKVIHLDAATKTQAAAVMLLHGTPAQQAEALTYVRHLPADDTEGGLT